MVTLITGYHILRYRLTERQRAGPELLHSTTGAEGEEETLMSDTDKTISELHKKIETLEEEIRKLRKASQALRVSERKFRLLADNVPEYFFYIDATHHYRYVNKGYERLYGLPRTQIVGKHLSVVLGEATYRALRPWIDRTLRGEETDFAIDLPSHPAGPKYMGIKGLPDLGECAPGDSDPAPGLFALVVDLTERKALEARLQSALDGLERKNIALEETLQQLEIEKANMRRDIAANVNETILPLLRRLRLRGASPKYVGLLRTELERLTSSFGRRIGDPMLGLTRREIEVCDMVRDGLTSKEIADFMNLSLETIHKHRQNIRRKLKVARRNINLATYLHSISRTGEEQER